MGGAGGYRPRVLDQEARSSEIVAGCWPPAPSAPPRGSRLLSAVPPSRGRDREMAPWVIRASFVPRRRATRSARRRCIISPDGGPLATPAERLDAFERLSSRLRHVPAARRDRRRRKALVQLCARLCAVWRARLRTLHAAAINRHRDGLESGHRGRRGRSAVAAALADRSRRTQRGFVAASCRR